MDTTLYLDVNRLLRATAWAHGFMRLYATWLGLALLAALVLISALRARGDMGADARHRVTAVLWTVAGAFVALGIAQPIAHLVGRSGPYDALRGVTVIVGHTRHGFSLPSDHATLAGAVAAGLWFSRDRLTASIATGVAVFLCFARVYVGSSYPGDVAAGFALGALVVICGYPIGTRLLRPIVELIGHSTLVELIGSGHPSRPIGPGPAAQQQPIGASGSVRLLAEPTRPAEPFDGEERRVVGSS